LPVLPLSTVMLGGFLGFGTNWALGVATFVLAQLRWRLRALLLAPLICYVGLSVFVNYMAARGEIRTLVWIEQAGISDRVQKIADVLDHFEWFDLSNTRHRSTIDDRLNQNLLVGAAVERLESGIVS